MLPSFFPLQPSSRPWRLANDFSRLAAGYEIVLDERHVKVARGPGVMRVSRFDIEHFNIGKRAPYILSPPFGSIMAGDAAAVRPSYAMQVPAIRRAFTSTFITGSSSAACVLHWPL